jgi:nucleoside-diphosphate-sugar epimerase
MRPANSYGRKFDTSFVIEYLVTQMLKDAIAYVGAPDSIRDYMHVDDHVNAYLAAIEDEKADGEIFNVGTGVGVSNRELAELIAKKIGFNMKKIKLGSYPPGYPFRPLASDQPYIVLDSAKIRKVLRWSPTVGLEEGIDKVIAYFKSHRRPS